MNNKTVITIILEKKIQDNKAVTSISVDVLDERIKEGKKFEVANDVADGLFDALKMFGKGESHLKHNIN